MKFTNRFGRNGKVMERYKDSVPPLSVSGIVIIELILLMGFAQALPMQLVFPGR